jgi:AraC-like DNA-binding protein
MIFVENKPLIFTPSFPDNWEVRRLPGAAPQYWSGREGQVLLQQLRTPRYLIEYYVYRFVSEVTVFCKRQAGLQSILSLEGAVEHRVGKLEPMQLAQSQFILVNGAGGPASTIVPPGQECHVLNTYYSQDLYRDFEEVFPNLDKGRQRPRRYFFLSPQPQLLRTRVLDAVRAQFHEQFRPDLQRAFFELKVKETLFSLLAQNDEPPSCQLDPRQKDIVEAARAWIMKDLSRHYSNGDIARAVGMNEADLKRLFRQAYGVGMFHFLQRLRFEKAHEFLLYETRSIKQVAAAVGYHHTTTFITEFRKFFGYTPSRVRGK